MTKIVSSSVFILLLVPLTSTDFLEPSQRNPILSYSIRTLIARMIHSIPDLKVGSYSMVAEHKLLTVNFTLEDLQIHNLSSISVTKLNARALRGIFKANASLAHLQADSRYYLRLRINRRNYYGRGVLKIIFKDILSSLSAKFVRTSWRPLRFKIVNDDTYTLQIQWGEQIIKFEGSYSDFGEWNNLVNSAAQTFLDVLLQDHIYVLKPYVLDAINTVLNPPTGLFKLEDLLSIKDIF